MAQPQVPFNASNHQATLALINGLQAKLRFHQQLKVNFYPNGNVQDVVITWSTGFSVAVGIVTAGLVFLVVTNAPLILASLSDLVAFAVQHMGKDAVLMILGQGGVKAAGVML
jgi:hypothetical protein